jgi:hypothetical protein
MYGSELGGRDGAASQGLGSTDPNEKPKNLHLLALPCDYLGKMTPVKLRKNRHDPIGKFF